MNPVLWHTRSAAIEFLAPHYANVYVTRTGQQLFGGMRYPTREAANIGVADRRDLKLAYRIRVIPKVRP